MSMTPFFPAANPNPNFTSVVVDDTLVVGGISDFSASGAYFGTASAANLLDDYEEGTFEVAFVTGASGTITVASARKTFAYTKVGRVVHVQGGIMADSVSTPLGSLRITGLPFVSSTLTQDADFAASVPFYVNLIGTFNGIITQISPSSTEIEVIEQTAASISDDFANHIQAASQLRFSFSYIAA